jgi:hypothetical protein
MAEKDPVSLDALNGLLKERQRYEEWLAALDDKRANTPASVYQRVQADYQSRLREVSAKLAERAGELRENIDALTLRLEDVSRQESQQREARQEAELRAAVVRYTDKQWKEIGEPGTRAGRLCKGEAASAAQLTELSRIFALSVKEKQAGAIAAGRGNSEDGARPPISPVVPRPAIPQPPAANPVPRAEAPVAPRPQQSQPQGAPNNRSPFDEFPVLRPGSGSGGSGAPPSTAVAAPPSVPGRRAPGIRDRATQGTSSAGCGAANYPTEWYCERAVGMATMLAGHDELQLKLPAGARRGSWGFGLQRV